MSSTNSAAGAAARLDGATLRLSGPLDRRHVPSLWRALPRDGFDALDLGEVSALDTVGLALLMHLAARDGGNGVAILRPPQGYAELRAAYRLAADPR